MRRRLVVAVAVVAALVVAVSGSAATLIVGSQPLVALQLPGIGPSLTTLQMFDDDTDGKVDRLVATFDRALAAYSAGTAGWTLSGVPSGGTLASVMVSGTQATLTITEGSGAANTAPTGFTVALAETTGGIRDSDGLLGSFPAVVPLDKAGPVPVSVSSADVGGINGEMQSGDTLDLLFSEPLDGATLPATTTVTEAEDNTSNDKITITSITSGAQSTGSDLYMGGKKIQTAGFANSTVTLAGGNTIRVTLGPTCSPNGPCNSLGAGIGAFSYAPATTILDVSGNAAAGAFTTATNFRLF